MKQGKKILIGICLVSILFSLRTLSTVVAFTPSLLGMSGDMIQDQDQDQDKIQECDQDCDKECCQDRDQEQEQDQDYNPV